MRGAFIFLAALLSTPAAAETQFPSLLGLTNSAPRSEAFARIAELKPEEKSAVQHIALASKSSNPVQLEIEALAGHRSFTSLTEQASPKRHLAISASNSVYGVGTAIRFALPIAPGWSIMPFASIDYNLVDSAKTVNKFSPRPFVRDNADTGLTGSLGAVLSLMSKKAGGIRVDGYGAVIVGNSKMASNQEFASVGAQVLNALNARGTKTAWAEFGVRARVSLAPRLQLQGAILRAVGPASSSSTAEMIGLRRSF
jgi:hypothetical protein